MGDFVTFSVNRELFSTTEILINIATKIQKSCTFQRKAYENCVHHQHGTRSFLY